MSEQIQRWRDVAALLKQGWRVEGHELVSPTGERRSAWLNAINACKARGLVPEAAPVSAGAESK